MMTNSHEADCPLVIGCERCHRRDRKAGGTVNLYRCPGCRVHICQECALATTHVFDCQPLFEQRTWLGKKINRLLARLVREKKEPWPNTKTSAH